MTKRMGKFKANSRKKIIKFKTLQYENFKRTRIKKGEVDNVLSMYSRGFLVQYEYEPILSKFIDRISCLELERVYQFGNQKGNQ